MENAQIEDGEQGKTLGNDAEVRFAIFGDRAVQGKVDTGATTSSLNATKMTVNKERNQVTFYSDALSDNMVTLDLAGSQEVHSADGGANARPMVKLDITVDGTPIQGAQFNLNDRSNMDSRVLIGQNVLKAGGFVIDPSRAAEPQDAAPMTPNNIKRESEILAAVKVLAENNVTLKDLLLLLTSVPKE